MLARYFIPSPIDDALVYSSVLRMYDKLIIGVTKLAKYGVFYICKIVKMLYSNRAGLDKTLMIGVTKLAKYGVF